MSSIALMSDLHLEFHADGGKDLIRKTIVPLGKEADVLVLAGDVSTGRGLGPALERICDAVASVVFVCGNHEYYRANPEAIHHILKTVALRRKNFHWLNHQTVEIDGVTFAGTTLWFPEPVGRTYENRFWLNDYNAIQDFEPWVYEEHAKAVAFLEEAVPTADVVVTHHMPADVCISERYRTGGWAAMNHFFCHDMTPMMEAEPGPKFWFYGHTHDRGRFQVRNTTLIGNPFGYPSEQGSRARGPYTEKLVVEVG